jgi:hypothetical protein
MIKNIRLKYDYDSPMESKEVIEYLSKTYTNLNHKELHSQAIKIMLKSDKLPIKNFEIITQRLMYKDVVKKINESTQIYELNLIFKSINLCKNKNLLNELNEMIKSKIDKLVENNENKIIIEENNETTKDTLNDDDEVNDMFTATNEDIADDYR